MISRAFCAFGRTFPLSNLMIVMIFGATALGGGPVASAFTYQGQLKENGVPTNGVFDFQFTLRQADGVTLVDRTCAFDVVVVNGLFQVEVEFAASGFDGSTRLLHVGVRNAAPSFPDCSPNTIGFLFDLLTPLQPITVAPYAIHALSAAPGSSLNAPDGAPINALVVDTAGNIGIGTAGHSIDARLHVENTGRVAKFDRFGSDGEIVAFARDDGVIGNISNVGGVVSYNAFTGSHYAWSGASIAAGALVSMTGENRRFGERDEAEVVYGVLETARANDPACLGVHLGPMESTRDLGPENPRLVAAVGNGELCVVDRGGGTIEPGGYLISSDVPGCAMKDDPSRFPVGYVVGRAADRVRWNDLPTGEPDSARHRRISVLLESFVRDSRGLSAASETRDLWAANAELRERLERLERLILQQRARANRGE